MTAMVKKREDIDEQQRRDLQASFNNRISYLCKLAALVIAVMAFGSAVLNHDDPHFVILGLSLAIVLLAIALLQDARQRK